MTQLDPTSLELLLPNLPTPSEVRHRARLLGAVLRQSKVDIYALLMVVVLGFVMRGPVAIAQLGHVFAETTGVRLARSAFWDRFTPAFADLVEWVLNRQVDAARASEPVVPKTLKGFRDVIAADATVVRLHDSLAGRWKGTWPNGPAALKVHAWVRVFTGELLKVKVTADAYGDNRAFGIEQGLRGVLVLLDRGYSSPSLWRRIDQVGGYFLTPLPADRNPVLTRLLKRVRGRSRAVEQRPLREVLDGLQRQILDVTGAFRCRVRKYRRSRNRWTTEDFRLVALRDAKTGEYRVYATNAPPELLPAELVGDVYRLRWEIETFFKTGKSGAGLKDQPSAKPAFVRVQVYAALLRATLSMQSLAKLKRLAPERAAPINPGQWMKWWRRQLHAALEELVSGTGLDLDDTLALLRDPNVGRTPHRRAFAEVW